MEKEKVISRLLGVLEEHVKLDDLTKIKIILALDKALESPKEVEEESSQKSKSKRTPESYVSKSKTVRYPEIKLRLDEHIFAQRVSDNKQEIYSDVDAVVREISKMIPGENAKGEPKRIYPYQVRRAIIHGGGLVSGWLIKRITVPTNQSSYEQKDV